VPDTLDNHARLARARAGYDKQRSLAVLDGGALFGIQLDLNASLSFNCHLGNPIVADFPPQVCSRKQRRFGGRAM
jgi:hypothetical protein